MLFGVQISSEYAEKTKKRLELLVKYQNRKQ